MVIDIPLTTWQPDNAVFNNSGLTVAKNVTAGIGNTQGQVTYNPVKSAALFASSSLSEPPQGIVVGTDENNVVHVYTGTKSHLSAFDSDNHVWTDATRISANYSTSDIDSWNFIEYGNAVIGTNFNDYPQFIQMATGSNFTDLTTLVKGKHIAVHKDFVILADTYDILDGGVPHRVRWSALGNPTSWDYSRSSQADFQDIQDVGAINGIFVDEDVWLLCKEAIVRMHYIGTPWIYQFENKVIGKGCAFPKSLVTVEGAAYFLDNDGFYKFSSGGLSPIGVGKVDNRFFELFDTNNAHKMTAVSDPQKTLIYWTFPSKLSSGGVPDTVFIYNYLTGDWTTSDATVPYLYPSKTLSWTINQLTETFHEIQNVPASFDSPLWAGGNSVLWGLDDSGKIYTLTGPNLPATLETREFQLSSLVAKEPNVRTDKAYVMAARPIFQGSGSASINVGYRGISNGFVNWTTPVATNQQTGFAYFRNNDRYHRFRINLTGNWEKVSVLQVDATPAGGR